MRSALRLLLCLVAAVLPSCGGVVRITVETTRPARIVGSSGTVCETTPCTTTVSRETCWLLDSSSGYLILEAVAPDGTSARSAAMKTCDLEEGERIVIELPPAK